VNKQFDETICLKQRMKQHKEYVSAEYLPRTDLVFDVTRRETQLSSYVAQ